MDSKKYSDPSRTTSWLVLDEADEAEVARLVAANAARADRRKQIQKQNTADEKTFFADVLQTTKYKKLPSQGDFGTVYVAGVPTDILSKLARKKIVSDKKDKILAVVKFTDPESGRREAAAMKRLASAPRFVCRGKTYYPRRHVPEVYAAIPLGDNYVLVTEYVRPSKGRPNPEDLEEAVLSMWSAGIVHADLHRGNIVVDAVTKTPKIIDFGFSVILPSRLRTKLRDRMCRDPDTALDGDPELRKYVAIQQARYGRSHVHWNTEALRHASSV